MRILVIDDELQVRKALRRMLEKDGYEVNEAPDGAVGLQLLQAQPFDVLITDIFMPEKEGIETIIEVKKRYPSVRTIAISGGGRGGHLDMLPNALFLGAHYTLEKPFTREELRTAIQTVLKDRIKAA
jgi:DNA-binding NtrC family response regulator